MIDEEEIKLVSQSDKIYFRRGKSVIQVEDFLFI